MIWGRVGANAVQGLARSSAHYGLGSVQRVDRAVLWRDGTEMVTGVSPADYVVTTLQVGDTLYIDRNDTIMSMPAELDGLVGIKTADRDTSNRSGAFLTFTVAQDATLYVAYDARATRFPDWLTDNYRRTNLVIGTTIAPLTVWQREVSAGPIKVPGNERGTPRGVDTNYIGLLASRSPQIWVWDQAMGDTIPILFSQRWHPHAADSAAGKWHQTGPPAHNERPGIHPLTETRGEGEYRASGAKDRVPTRRLRHTLPSPLRAVLLPIKPSVYETFLGLTTPARFPRMVQKIPSRINLFLAIVRGVCP